MIKFRRSNAFIVFFHFASNAGPIDRRVPAQDQAVPGIRTKQRLTILSANDGACSRAVATRTRRRVTPDSITVIHLGPDHPPIVKTVYGTVPNTISGPPYMAMTGDGRYGFVTSRKSKDEPDAPELISVIDLASDDLKVVQTVKLPDPRMAVMHPDGKRLLDPVRHRHPRLRDARRPARARQGQPDRLPPPQYRHQPARRSRRRQRHKEEGGKLTVHVLSYRDGDISYQSEVKIKPGLPDWDGPFACRFTPDGKRIVIPNGWHNGSHGTLAPVFIADVTLDPPTVTEVSSASRRRHRRRRHSSQRQVRRAQLPGGQPAPRASGLQPSGGHRSDLASRRGCCITWTSKACRKAWSSRPTARNCSSA